MNNSEQLEKIEQIKEFLKQKDIKNIYLVFTDTNGKILYKSVGVEELIRNTHVSWFDGISINGNLIEDFKTSKKSEWLVILPDANAFYYLPFINEKEQSSCMIICDYKAFPYDTRKLLKDVVEKYLEMGITPIIGPEYIYSLNEKNKQDFYCSLPVYNYNKFNNKLVNNLLDTNIDIEYYMPFGNKHNRIDLVPDVANISADKLLVCRWFSENLAYLENTSILLSSPGDETISSCPSHFSLWKGNREKNLFFDGEEENELSMLGNKFINGVLYFNKFIKAVIKSCTKQEVKNYMVNYSTNRDNSLIQVPLYFNEKQKKDRIGWSKRCIFNGINADCNYYLVYATILYAGFIGINNNKFFEIEKRNDDYTNTELIEEVENNQFFKEVFNTELIKKIVEKLKS